MELAAALAVGAPVPSPSFVACLLFACGERPHLAAEGEGRGGAQPGVPIRRAYSEPTRLSIPLVEQDIFLYYRHSLLLVAHGCHHMYRKVTGQYSTCSVTADE